MQPENPLLDEFVLSLAGSSCPRVCFLPTASGDAEGYVARFYRAFSALDCRSTDREVVSSRASAAAYRVDKAGSGVSEQRLAARYLG